MYRQLAIATVALVAVTGSTACATKKFVRTSVGEVNTKVDSLGRSLEETQQRTKANEAKIAEVDQRAQTAASQAKSAADQANSAAGAAATTANAANAKANDLDKAVKKITFEVVLNDARGDFKSGSAALPDSAKAAIDELVSKLKADPKGAFFEIEGHTDNTGSAEANEKLGQARAEAVKSYLYEKHQIALHKISVISYGETKPVAPNTTRAGRAQNRRIVVKVVN